MAGTGEFAEFLIDQLRPLGPVAGRRMFGGVGLFLDGRMFAIVMRDNGFFLKVDALTRAQFVAAGCQPFVYAAKGRGAVTLSYYAPPAEVFDDAQALLSWARLAVAAAERAPEKRRR